VLCTLQRLLKAPYLVVRVGVDVPRYLRQMVDVTCIAGMVVK
jgi:hypothetical protein